MNMGLEDYLQVTQSDKYIKYILRGCFSLWGICGTTISLFLLVATIVSYIPFDKEPEKYKFWITIAIVALWLIFIILRYYFYNPKTPKGNIGIVIAIEDYGDFESYCMIEDFIDSMKETLPQNFTIIKLLRRDISKIIKIKIKNEEEHEVFQKLNNKLSAHYRIFGKVKKEKDGELKYFLDIKGLVFHNAISTLAESEMLQDFSRIFPQEITFSENFYRKGYKFSGKHNAIVAQYIIGVAQLISGNPFAAWQLHKDLDLVNLKKEEDIDASFDDHYIKDLIEKIKTIQYHEVSLISRYWYYKKNTELWEKNLIERNKLSELYGKKDSILYINNAIYEYLINKDIIKAKRMLKESRKHSNQPGRIYSLIFLYLCEKDYIQAKKHMKLVARRSFNQEKILVQEIIFFIDDVLKTESEENKFELLYWKAYLYYKKLYNIPRAYTNIEKYLTYTAGKKYSFEILDAKEILRESKREMQLN